MGWWGGVACLIIVSTPGPGFVMIKVMFGQVDDEVRHALFGQVGDQVGQVKDQLCQGQGQELDNNLKCIFKTKVSFLSNAKKGFF